MLRLIKTFLIPIVVAVAGLVITLAVAQQVQKSEKEVIRTELAGNVDRWVSLMRFALEKEINLFLAIRQMFEEQITMSSASFQLFSDSTLQLYPGMEAIFWAPKVDSSQRELFEQSMQSKHPGYLIRDFAGPVAGMVPAAPAENWVPIYFVNTRSENTPYLGWNLQGFGNLNSSFQQLQTASDTDMAMQFLPSLSDLLNPDPQQQATRQIKLMIVSPLNVMTELADGSTSPDSGYLGVMVNIRELFRYFSNLPSGDKLKILVTSGAGEDAEPIFPPPPYNGRLLPEYRIEDVFNSRASRSWYLSLTPTDLYFLERGSSTVDWIYAFGLSATGLLVIYLVSMQRREQIIREQVENQTRQLKQANEKLNQLSRVDYLTGTINRRHFDENLHREWARAARGKQFVSLILLDVDFFKQYNDHYGHILGDECLQKVAHALQQVIKRPADMVARFGGEEFIILLSQAGDKADVVAERCRQAVENLRIPHCRSEAADVVTISLGMASLRAEPGKPVQTLLSAADQALYKAKDKGRNCCVIASTEKMPVSSD